MIRHRRNPERVLIDQEDDDRFDAETRADRLARNADRRELTEAWVRYARKHGLHEAIGWAAARAHFDPAANDAAQPRRRAERKFSRLRGAA